MSWDILLLCIASFVVSTILGLEPERKSLDAPSRSTTSERDPPER